MAKEETEPTKKKETGKKFYLHYLNHSTDEETKLTKVEYEMVEKKYLDVLFKGKTDVPKDFEIENKSDGKYIEVLKKYKDLSKEKKKQTEPKTVSQELKKLEDDFNQVKHRYLGAIPMSYIIVEFKDFKSAKKFIKDWVNATTYKKTSSRTNRCSIIEIEDENIRDEKFCIMGTDLTKDKWEELNSLFMLYKSENNLVG